METLLNSKDWSKLFKMYYGINVSLSFFDCAGAQLGRQFKELTGLKVDRPLLFWEQENPPIIQSGKLSTLSSHIFAKYGKLPVTIMWTSKSGNVYHLDDENIDCSDICFELVNFDTEKFKRYHKPDFSTFFPLYENTVESLTQVAGQDVSPLFVKCMDKQLSKYFIDNTGIRPSKDVSLSFMGREFFYQSDTISTMAVTLYVNSHGHRDITIKWKSKSGQVYKLSDTAIECYDIVFWLENLSPDVYLGELYPYGAPSLNIKNLTYDLTINRLGIDCSLDMVVKSEKLSEVDSMLEDIYTFINDFNEKSEKKNRSLGLVHNCRSTIDNDVVTLDLDLGSAGVDFLKKLLSFISSSDVFKSVTVN